MKLTEPTWSLESAGVAYSKRIILNGEIVAFASQLANGWWAVFDTSDRRVSGLPPLQSPKRCLTAFKRSDAGRLALQGAQDERA